MAYEWRTLKLRSKLIDEMERAVSQLKDYSVPRYSSVPDFIQDACIDLLAKEGYKSALDKAKKKEVAIR